MVSSALGYNGASKQYKVLRLLSSNIRKSLVAEVVTSGMNTTGWRHVGDSPLSNLSRVFLNDAIYGFSCESNRIWCFNFGSEFFTQVNVFNDMIGQRIT